MDAACVLADLTYSFLSEGCTPPDGPDAPVWLEVLSRISLAITTFFLVEIPLSIFAFGLQFYNPFGPVPHSGLHLFDAIIIGTTFILEVVLRGRERELASLLIILRLWRLVKLVGGEEMHALITTQNVTTDIICTGVAVGVGEVEEGNLKELAQTRREMEGIITALSEAKEENHQLRLRIAKFEPRDSASEP